MSPSISPAAAKDRFEVYRFLNGVSAEGHEGVKFARSHVPLVKTFLLEHVSSRTGGTPKSPETIWQALGVETRALDESFFELKVWESGEAGRPISRIAGYLEQFDDRFFAFYTAELAECARKRVNRWIQRSAELDSTWFSGQLLQWLWDRDVSHRGDGCFTKLVFRHESIFDMPEDFSEVADFDEDENREKLPAEDRPERDRRRVRSEFRDRIKPIRQALQELQGFYPPLHALYALRFPSQAARGSHDLYQMGQITNRADSFEDHRNTVRYFYRIYKSLLENTEESAWLAPVASMTNGPASSNFKGVPLIIHFGERLSTATFNRWVALAFQKRNRFRLWGDPLRLGPTKVHVYGADRHLWQPINLELTADRLVAILPKGTCGNTFHRLVTNVQRYVSPKIDVWLGSKPFSQLVEETQLDSGAAR